MGEYFDLLKTVLPVLGIMAAGYGMRRLDWLTAEADASLMRVVVNVLTPCLIADTILGNSAFARAGNVLLPPILGFVTTAAGILIAWACRPLLGAGVSPAEQRTFAVTVGICNYGYIPLPLAQFLFSTGTVGVLFVQNVGVELCMWLLGVALLQGGPRSGNWRGLLNPPAIAILAALLVNTATRREDIPDVLLSAMRLLGQCAIPMGLVLIGATIADLMSELRTRRGLRLIGIACLLRLGVIPALVLVLARAIPASVEVRQVLLLHAAMPSAVFPIIMARHFGGHAGTALRIVLGTSIMGVVLIPVWLKFGMEFLGLQPRSPFTP